MIELSRWSVAAGLTLQNHLNPKKSGRWKRPEKAGSHLRRTDFPLLRAREKPVAMKTVRQSPMETNLHFIEHLQ